MVEFHPSEIPKPLELPFTRVDALMVLGIGGNTRLLGPDRHAVIEEQRMRINAIAAKELSAHHNIPEETVIVPTGQFTELVKFHYDRLETRQKTKPDPAEGSFLEFRALMGQPADEGELRRSAAVSQGELMNDLMKRAVPKGGERAGLAQEVLEERIARNTILNFIETLNVLDEKAGGLWEGNLAVLTTDTGHLQRSLEIGRSLALGEILPISSEGTLLHFGYDKTYLTSMLKVSDNDLREQEKNLRAISEMPEFVIPELVYVKNDERLKKIVAHMAAYYGQAALEKYGISNFEHMSVSDIRRQVGKPSADRTRYAFEALSEKDRADYLSTLDIDKDFQEIRRILASDVKATEAVRSALIAKYGAQSGWFEANELPKIETTEAYRIKNWLFGRLLPPNSWRDSAVPEKWRQQNIAYNEMTESWINGSVSK